jgi:hypothetical protein
LSHKWRFHKCLKSCCYFATKIPLLPEEDRDLASSVCGSFHRSRYCDSSDLCSHFHYSSPDPDPDPDPAPAPYCRTAISSPLSATRCACFHYLETLRAQQSGFPRQSSVRACLFLLARRGLTEIANIFPTDNSNVLSRISTPICVSLFWKIRERLQYCCISQKASANELQTLSRSQQLISS